MKTSRAGFILAATAVLIVGFIFWPKSALVEAEDAAHEHAAPKGTIRFSVRSVQDGNWSDSKTWEPSKVPAAGDRVLISGETRVNYDVKSDAVLRLVQIVGTLSFARDRDTELNVGVMKVQSSNHCTESGFACDFHGVNAAGEPQEPGDGTMPTLEIGTLDNPIPAEHTARIRLHFLDGMDKHDAPALACCSARMELHGAPLSACWMKLGKPAAPGDDSVTLAEPVTGWRVGDEVIITGSEHNYHQDSLRKDPDNAETEERTITRIDGATLFLNKPLAKVHYGEGDFRSEVANLSRNVTIESADPAGERGHTLFHAYSRGSISYVRFAHLGKEGVLGRYAIHFHLVGDTMRGAQVLGAAIVDSHNRWVTIHGTEYLVVRDCVGYQSVGHGFFMEDGSEVFNLLDHNLGVQAYRGKSLPKQVLPFDPNDGAAFWWSNGRNSLTRNVACENAEYGFRYDLQKGSSFDTNLAVRMPDGEYRSVDVRTLPISRFSDNESHTEGLYSMVFAGTRGVGPDTRHPHHLSNLKMWQTHYALRSELPTMLVENVNIHHAAYGIYRPWYDNHVYRNLRIASTNAEPFNRGMDDQSMQYGSITVDGLTFAEMGYGGQMPLIQISDDSAAENIASHFRRVEVVGRKETNRWPLVNLGGGPRPTPKTPQGVPVFIHDFYGENRAAKVVSTKAKDLLADGNTYRADPPLTGDESVAAEVRDVPWPELLDPVDDLPPATIITSVSVVGDAWRVRGVSHDDGDIASVIVNGKTAALETTCGGVADWQVEITRDVQEILAHAVDAKGNVEQTPHKLRP